MAGGQGDFTFKPSPAARKGLKNPPKHRRGLPAGGVELLSCVGGLVWWKRAVRLL
jgi:hypothetical protein